MKKDLYEKKFNEFINTNEILVNSYNTTWNKDLYDIKDDIYVAMCANETNTNVKSLLAYFISKSVDEHEDIFDVIEQHYKSKAFSKSETRNSLTIYLEEVNKIYEENGNDYDVEYCEENKEKLIEMNLRSVVSLSKGFRGMGVSMEDIISAGNLGLCIAFNKFNPERNIIKKKILDKLPLDNKELLEYSKIREIIEEYITYGNVKVKFFEDFAEGKEYSVAFIRKWINSNITSAKFNSVAIQWIKAYMYIELNNNSRIVKKPKVEIQKEKKYGRDIYIDIKKPVGENSGNCFEDILYIEDEKVSEQENIEAQHIFRDALIEMLEGVKSRDRRILMEKFGIGFPRPLTSKEIANREGISIARTSQIIQDTLETMKRNCEVKGIDSKPLYEAVACLY